MNNQRIVGTKKHHGHLILSTLTNITKRTRSLVLGERQICSFVKCTLYDTYFDFHIIQEGKPLFVTEKIIQENCDLDSWARASTSIP